MPIQRCKRSGQDGWRWGNSGFCYLGPDAKDKATKQGAAIETSKKDGGSTKEPGMPVD